MGFTTYSKLRCLSLVKSKVSLEIKVASLLLGRSVVGS